MGEGTLSEAIYAFIGAYAWYLTFGLYALLAVLQAMLSGGFSFRRPKRVLATSGSGDAE